MMLDDADWRTYHESICSPGLPWDCVLNCALKRQWDWQMQSALADGPTYSQIKRSE